MKSFLSLTKEKKLVMDKDPKIVSKCTEEEM